MKRIAVMAAMGVALAGCGGNDVTTADADTDNDGAVSIDEAVQVAEASGMQPQAGKYRASTKVAGVDTDVEYCITPEEAEAGFEGMMKEGQQGDCSYEKFELAGNDLDAVMVCKMDGGSMRMEMDGTVSPTSSDLDMKMSGNMAGMNVDMTVKSKHERIGDCDE
ncbi:MAG: DUF3617 domain-containing protein [Pseudomonadota bacterium]